MKNFTFILSSFLIVELFGVFCFVVIFSLAGFRVTLSELKWLIIPGIVDIMGNLIYIIRHNLYIKNLINNKL